MDKLEQLVKVYLEQVENVANYSNVIIGELIKFYEGCDPMVRILKGIKDTNDDLIKQVQLRDKLAISPEDTVTVVLRIDEINSGILSAINAILTIEHTPVIVPVFAKVINNSNNIHGYINDLLRTYIVNLPDDIKDDYLNKLDGTTLESVARVIKEVVEYNPEDIEGKKLLSVLETKMAINNIVEDTTNAKDSEEKRHLV